MAEKGSTCTRWTYIGIWDLRGLKCGVGKAEEWEAQQKETQGMYNMTGRGRSRNRAGSTASKCRHLLPRHRLAKEVDIRSTYHRSPLKKLKSHWTKAKMVTLPGKRVLQGEKREAMERSNSLHQESRNVGLEERGKEEQTFLGQGIHPQDLKPLPHIHFTFSSLGCF